MRAINYKLRNGSDGQITKCVRLGSRHLTGEKPPLTISLMSLSISHLVDRSDPAAGSRL